MKVNVHYLEWYVRQQLIRLGLVGTAGLGLLAFCVMFYLSALLPLQQEVATLASGNAESRAGRVAGADPGSLPAGQLEEFYRHFPRLARQPDVIESLNRVASAHGVDLEQGEYRQSPAGAEGLVRYEMTLPVKGDYLHLRAFLSDLLAEWPNLSLDSIAFQRDNVSDPTLNAELKLTAFFLER